MYLSGLDPLTITYALLKRDADDAPPTPTLMATGVHPSTTFLIAFYALQIIGGQIGFPLVLFIIAIRRTGLPAIRHPVFLNFYVTWIISSFSFCLLLYTGTQSGPEPPWGLCATQAVLGYSVPVLTASALSAIIFHLWLSVNHVLENKRLHRHYNAWLVALPYLLAVVYAIYPIVLAIRDPGSVIRKDTGYYCSLEDRGPSIVVASTVLVLLLITTVFEVLIGIKLWNNRSSFGCVRIQGWKSIQLFARLGLFHLYSLLVLVACVQSIVAPKRSERIFFQASLPTAAFLAFGTRPDLFQRNSAATDNDEQTCPHDQGHSTTNGSAAIGEQPKFSPPKPRTRTRFPSIPQSRSTASRVWPLWTHKESPSQAWARESRLDSYGSQIPLRLDTNKLQIRSRTDSRESSMHHDSMSSNTMTTTTSLNARRLARLDETFGGPGFLPTFVNSPISLHPPLTIRQETVEGGGEVKTPQQSQAPVRRPIRPLPTPPAVGRVPSYVESERDREVEYISANERLRGKSGSKLTNRAPTPVPLVEVYTETAYYYDPPSTNGHPAARARNESVGTVLVDGPGVAVGGVYFQPEGIGLGMAL